VSRRLPLGASPPPRADGGADHDHQMVHGCDSFELHDSRVAKLAIKIRNENSQKGHKAPRTRGLPLCVARRRSRVRDGMTGCAKHPPRHPLAPDHPGVSHASRKTRRQSISEDRAHLGRKPLACEARPATAPAPPALAPYHRDLRRRVPTRYGSSAACSTHSPKKSHNVCGLPGPLHPLN
jgi:hypothetical protein